MVEVLQVIKNKILKVKKGNASLLDVGCGYGKEYEKFCGYSIGLDVQLHRLKIAKTKINDVVLCDLNFGLPIRNNSVDVVVSIEVLEHIKYENGLNLINEIERVTKHKILITTPSYYFQTYTKKKLQKYLSHLSFFPISFFKKRNYIARGFRFSVLRNAFIDDKLNFIIPMFIPYFIPYLAKYVLYEKNIKRKP